MLSLTCKWVLCRRRYQLNPSLISIAGHQPHVTKRFILGHYTLSDFKAGAALAKLGFEGASEQGASLLKFQLDDRSWQDHVNARRARRRTDIPQPVDAAGVQGDKADEIKRDVHDEVGRTPEPERLDRKLSEIRGGGRYESVAYDVVQLEREPRLRIHAKEKSYGPPLITPKLQIESTHSSDVDLAAGFRLTNFDIGAYGAELRIDVIVGSRNLFGVEYYRPIPASGWISAGVARPKRSTRVVGTGAGKFSSSGQTEIICMT